MTEHEKVVISAFTGYLLCDEFSKVHKYIEEKVGRPVFTHELASSNTKFLADVQEKIRPDFMAIISAPDETEACKEMLKEAIQIKCDGCEWMSNQGKCDLPNGMCCAQKWRVAIGRDGGKEDK